MRTHLQGSDRKYSKKALRESSSIVQHHERHNATPTG
ncbi:hypothetical protein FOMCTCXJ_CDS_0010 [Pseudomonas phage Athelas]|nr:hypothetical protein FOMCTCXJ_CDS_0010 [Pseudomonas phage Athelas]